MPKLPGSVVGRFPPIPGRFIPPLPPGRVMFPMLGRFMPPTLGRFMGILGRAMLPMLGRFMGIFGRAMLPMLGRFIGIDGRAAAGRFMGMDGRVMPPPPGPRHATAGTTTATAGHSATPASLGVCQLRGTQENEEPQQGDQFSLAEHGFLERCMGAG